MKNIDIIEEIVNNLNDITFYNVAHSEFIGNYKNYTVAAYQNSISIIDKVRYYKDYNNGDTLIKLLYNSFTTQDYVNKKINFDPSEIHKTIFRKFKINRGEKFIDHIKSFDSLFAKERNNKINYILKK